MKTKNHIEMKQNAFLKVDTFMTLTKFRKNLLYYIVKTHMIVFCFSDVISFEIMT